MCVTLAAGCGRWEPLALLYCSQAVLLLSLQPSRPYFPSREKETKRQRSLSPPLLLSLRRPKGGRNGVSLEHVNDAQRHGGAASRRTVFSSFTSLFPFPFVFAELFAAFVTHFPNLSSPFLSLLPCLSVCVCPFALTLRRSPPPIRALCFHRPHARPVIQLEKGDGREREREGRKKT